MSPTVGAAPAPAPRDASRHMRLLRGGDPHAVDELYRDYQPRLLAFSRQMLGNQEEAEDAVQLTFLAAHVQLPHEPLETNVSAWLYTVARRKCIDTIRRRRPTEPLEGDEMVSTRGLAAEVEQREDLRRLVADVQRLDEPHRAALVLTQLEALPQAEVATVLGTHEGRVRRLVFEARQSLLDRRESRDLECRKVQEELANARGSQFRRRHLVHHCEECEDCRRYRTALLEQRTSLKAIMLPALPLAFGAKKSWAATSVPHPRPRLAQRLLRGAGHVPAHGMAALVTVATFGVVAALPQQPNVAFDDGVPAAGRAAPPATQQAASSNAPAPAARHAKARRRHASPARARTRARARAAAVVVLPAPTVAAAPVAASPFVASTPAPSSGAAPRAQPPFAGAPSTAAPQTAAAAPVPTTELPATTAPALTPAGTTPTTGGGGDTGTPPDGGTTVTPPVTGGDTPPSDDGKQCNNGSSGGNNGSGQGQGCAPDGGPGSPGNGEGQGGGEGQGQGGGEGQGQGQGGEGQGQGQGGEGQGGGRP